MASGSIVETNRAITIGAGGGAIDAQGTADVTLFGAVSGAGALSKNGTGTLTLSGANTYSGGTAVNAGTLRAGATDVFGTGTMQVNAAGTLDLNSFNQRVGSLSGAGAVTLGSATLDAGSDNSSTLFSGAISGSGGLVKSGTGVMTLTGANTYTGGTLISGGTLAGDSTSLHGAIQDNARLQLDQTADGTFTGTIGGTGSVTKNGAGVLVLNGTNSYTGGTTVNAGALVGDTASLQGDIANNAVVGFNQASAGTYAGAMSGSGSLVKLGNGTLTLTGANTYTGGTLISGGTLVGDSTSLQGDIQDDASLVFNQNADGTYGGTIAGTGHMTKSGTGTLTLTGQSGYTGGTTISGGTLAGNTQNLQGAIQDDARLQFEQAANGTFTGAITGTGSLTKNGAGTLVLNGTNTYSGGTSVNAGALIGDTASLQGAIVNNAVVGFDQASAGTYAGIMSGSGSLVKLGNGTLTLTGANSYTGGTLISGGTLVGDTTSLHGDIQNNASLVFNQTADGTYGGTLLGTGGLTKTGGGTLTLTGQATYTGGTTISGGTLAGTTQNLQGAIRNDAALLFNQSFDGLFSGSISGSGSVTKSGSGTLFLGGANSYTGGTVINAGTVVGSTSSLQGAILNNGTVWFDQGASGTYTGSMSGSGSLVKTGSGTLTLTGTNTFAGGTSVSGGALSIAQDAALGAASGSVALSNAALTFTNSGLLSSTRGFLLGAGGATFDTTGAQVTLAGALSGDGGLTKTGGGVLELDGANSYTGGTVVAAGTLRAGAANAFGTGNALTVASGAAADLNGFSQSVTSLSGNGSILLGTGTLTTGLGGASSLFAGSIAGGGSLVKTGGGTLFLTGANSYSGGTSVLGGALVGNASSLQGNILDNGVVQFDQSAAGTYAGSLSGTGSLLKSGSGVLTLTGTNTHSGGTFINGGGIVATTSSLSGTVFNEGTLTLGGAADGVFNGVITGSGVLNKAGSGTLTFNGIQPMSGSLSVTQGTLALNGGAGGSVDVAAGGTLRANGFIGGSLNVAGSLFAGPGAGGLSAASQTTASAGDHLANAPYLTVAGNLALTNGAHVGFDVGPGTAPTMLVGGTATVNGVHFTVGAPAIGDARSAAFLAIAAANGLSFSNSDITTGDPGLVSGLKQTSNALYVTLLNLYVPLARTAGPGTIEVADAIDRTKRTATGDGEFVVHELTALDDKDLKNALEQVGGQLHASVLQAAILDTESVTDLIRDQLSAREMDEGNDVRWWGETACQRADFDATDHARGGNANVCAGAGGADRRYSEKWTLGAGGSYSDGRMGIGSMGSGDYTAPRAFGYAGYKPSTLGVRFGGSGAASNYQTQRQIQFQAVLPPELGGAPIDEGVNRKAEAQQQGSTSDQWSEIHDSRKVKTYTIDALVGVRHARISRGAFEESGAMALSLNGQDEILNLTQTDVRVHVWRRSGTYRPFLDGSYRRELAADNTQAAVAFDGLPKSDFIVEGINIPANSYSARGGMTIATMFGQATFTYEYKAAPGQRRQTVGFRVRFK